MKTPWESHGNGNKTQNWEWEWEEMGNHLSGNGNYLHSHGNLFPKVLCCDEFIKLLVLYLPDTNACAEFAEAEPECERFFSTVIIND